MGGCPRLCRQSHGTGRKTIVTAGYDLIKQALVYPGASSQLGEGGALASGCSASCSTVAVCRAAASRVRPFPGGKLHGCAEVAPA